MNVNQQKNLQKIMLAFDKDYRLSEQLYDRQVELIESIRLHQLASTFDVVTGKGVRQEVLEAAKDSPEFEELMDAYRREAMAISRAPEEMLMAFTSAAMNYSTVSELDKAYKYIAQKLSDDDELLAKATDVYSVRREELNETSM